MITVDPPELVSPRFRRLVQAAGMLGIDEWLLTTSTAVRTATGAWSDDVDLVGEWAWPMVAVGSTVLSPGRPPDDPSLIDQLIDLLPSEGTIAVDRMGQPALDRLAELRPALKIADARVLLAAANAPRDQAEIDVLVEAHRRTEKILASMISLVQPGVTERELNAEFMYRAAESGFDRIHVDTVFSVLPKERAQASWVRGQWEAHAPYRELTTERIIEGGDHVAFDAGLGYLGYTADVGTTLYAGDSRPLARRTGPGQEVGRGGATGDRSRPARRQRPPGAPRRPRRLGPGRPAPLALSAVRGPRSGHRAGRASVHWRRVRARGRSSDGRGRRKRAHGRAVHLRGGRRRLPGRVLRRCRRRRSRDRQHPPLWRLARLLRPSLVADQIDPGLNPPVSTEVHWNIIKLTHCAQ